MVQLLNDTSEFFPGNMPRELGRRCQQLIVNGEWLIVDMQNTNPLEAFEAAISGLSIHLPYDVFFKGWLLA